MLESGVSLNEEERSDVHFSVHNNQFLQKSDNRFSNASVDVERKTAAQDGGRILATMERLEDERQLME